MEMDLKSPATTCPYTVTARRNPHRKARPTPATNVSTLPAKSTFNVAQDISSFPLDDILSIQVAQDVQSMPNPSPSLSENLSVFLRIRPLKTLQMSRKLGDSKSLLRSKNVWPQNPATKNVIKEKKSVKKSEVCIVVNDDLKSVTLSPPLAVQDTKKMKTEVYEGYSHVFSADSSQGEVYERMVNPLVEEFLCGKSGMLAALGPSGSGKTHTVFGCVREPGMVPRILRKIFEQNKGIRHEPPRTFYLSIFEICSEKGKGERIIDLFPDGGDVFISQSGIRGLKELRICDVAEAEALIACGLMRRATATTNTNSQSSRSQCIINIRYDLKACNQGDDTQVESAVLTVVDLAGAEREKRTGNQGARLLESNFINNTSMVLGLCLRALLEHQKNPKKKLQKHFQNSLLTRYLRDYLEGKKRMTLILTVKPGEEDYLDTSHLLRQASPYMKIKFNLVEKTSTLPSNKRLFQPFLKSEQHKRAKVNCVEECENLGISIGVVEIEEQKSEHPHNIGGTIPELLKNTEPLIAPLQSPQILKSDPHFNGAFSSDDKAQNSERYNQVMRNFAKATWNVLKEYRDKLRVAESELCNLRIENARCVELEKELREYKLRCSCSIGTSAHGSSILTISEPSDETSSEEGDAKTLHESNEDKCSVNPAASEDIERLKTYESPVGNDQLIHLQSKTSCMVDSCDEALEQGEDLFLSGQMHMQSSDKANNTQLYIEDPNQQCVQYTNNKHGSYLENFEEAAKDSNALNIFGGEVVFSIEEEIGPIGNRLTEVIESSSPIVEVSNVSPSTAEYTNKRHSETLKETEHSDALNISISEDICSNVEETENSSHSLVEVSNDNPSKVKIEQQNTELNETCLALSTFSQTMLDPPQPSSKDQDIMKESKDGKVQEEHKQNSNCKPIVIEKPKRKLLPASSILLRDVTCLDFHDENEKPKVNRGEKKSVADERYMTQGSASLLRLLQSNLRL